MLLLKPSSYCYNTATKNGDIKVNGNDDFLREILGVSKTPAPSSSNPLLNTLLPTPKPLIPTGLPTPTPKGLPLIKIITPQQKAENELKKELRSMADLDLTKTLARILPALDSLSFADSKEIETSILYIDIRNSSSITASHIPDNAAKIYKMFHKAMVWAGKKYKGQVGGFAGDRTMIVFPFGKDEAPCTNAAKTAIYMQYVLHNVLNPILEEKFKHPLQCGVGIDFGKVLVARVGQQGTGNNERIWAGNAANKASKLADLSEGIYVSKKLFDGMNSDSLKTPERTWQTFVDSNQNVVYYKYTGVSKPL